MGLAFSLRQSTETGAGRSKHIFARSNANRYANPIAAHANTYAYSYGDRYRDQHTDSESLVRRMDAEATVSWQRHCH
jgi:hypothetical protein